MLKTGEAMFTKIQSVRIIVTALAVGSMLGAAAVPAAAWPIPLTAEDTGFLNATRGNFPGDDDQLLLVGRQMCRGLYAGQSSQAVLDETAATYGATADQAAIVLGAARSAYCTQAPG